jgi:hypothetical protein
MVIVYLQCVLNIISSDEMDTTGDDPEYMAEEDSDAWRQYMSRKLNRAIAIKL